MSDLSPALLGALEHLFFVTQESAVRCRAASLADAADRGDVAAVKRELHGLWCTLCIDAADWSESFCADVLGTDLERQEPLQDAGSSVAKLYAETLALVAAELKRPRFCACARGKGAP